MRYYLYVSRTKVEMLHSQLGSTFFGKLKFGLKFRMPAVEASLEREALDDELFTKAEAVRKALMKKGRLGSLESPKSFIDDCATLRFGNVEEYASSMAFFGGHVGPKKVALIGSSSSIVGVAPKLETNHAPFYYTMKFINDAVNQESTLDTEIPYVDSLEEAVDIALAAARTPEEKFCFTARVLYDTPRLLVAAPIMVAYPD